MRKATAAMLDDPRELAQRQAQVWDGNAYYEHAEGWTWLFWDASKPFRQMFAELDLDSVVELACGHGRHAEYLIKHVSFGSLVAMDILESNIERCRSRIADPRVRFILNDGTSFRPIHDATVSASFCYDAMVHFDRSVVRAYLRDTARILRPGGRALYHHSNYHASETTHFTTNPHARAYMTQELFREYAADAGLRVLRQQLMPWGDVPQLDCLTLLETSA